jgi:hypothetical protein
LFLFHSSDSRRTLSFPVTYILSRGKPFISSLILLLAFYFCFRSSRNDCGTCSLQRFSTLLSCFCQIAPLDSSGILLALCRYNWLISFAHCWNLIYCEAKSLHTSWGMAQYMEQIRNTLQFARVCVCVCVCVCIYIYIYMERSLTCFQTPDSCP